MSTSDDTKKAKELARLRKLIDSPAIRMSCGLDCKTVDQNDGDNRPENTKLPSPERVHAINKMFLSHLGPADPVHLTLIKGGKYGK